MVADERNPRRGNQRREPGLPNTFAIADALRRREAEVSSAIGGGVAVPCAYAAGASSAAALVTLARPLSYDTPDGMPLRLVIVLFGTRGADDRLLRLAHIASLTARGLADQLAQMESPSQILSLLTLLEAPL